MGVVYVSVRFDNKSYEEYQKIKEEIEAKVKEIDETAEVTVRYEEV